VSAKKHDEPVDEAPKVVKPHGKGRPTPTRREAEARNQRPLVPSDRKAAKRAAREKRNIEWDKQQAAMRTGDDSKMPPQHRGKVRKFGRDYVDARWNVGEFFFPAAILIIAAMLLSGLNPNIAFWVTVGAYVAFIIMILDSFLMSGRLKKRATELFGAAEIPRGFRMQMFGRSFYFRKMRMPRPQVQRGEWPAGAKKDR